jgi:hypothetical protein
MAASAAAAMQSVSRPGQAPSSERRVSPAPMRALARPAPPNLQSVRPVADHERRSPIPGVATHSGPGPVRPAAISNGDFARVPVAAIRGQRPGRRAGLVPPSVVPGGRNATDPDRGQAAAHGLRDITAPVTAHGHPDDRTYHPRDSHAIGLPPGMTAAEAAKLESDGAAAPQRLGRRPQSTSKLPAHAPTRRAGIGGSSPESFKAPDRGGQAAAAAMRSVARAEAGRELAPMAGRVGQYLIARGQPALTSGFDKLHTLSRHERTHNSAHQKIREAEQAVSIPVSEGQATSNFRQVATLAEHPAPAIDAARGKRQLQESLVQNVPKTIEDVDNFKHDQKAQLIGAEVLQTVQIDASAVLTTFAGLERTPSPAPEQTPQPLPPLEIAPPTAAMNLGRGIVAPLLPEHTALGQYTREANAVLREEGITQEQLNMVDSGDLAAANREKKSLEQAARSEPPAAHRFALDEAARVDHSLQQQERTERGALASQRKHGLDLASQQQKGAKTALEKKRDEVAATIIGKYKLAQDHVKQRLADLETQSMKRFAEGNTLAAKAFEDDVSRELDAYKDDRYSGHFGWTRKAKDWLLGIDDLPGVKSIFERNRSAFAGKIEKLVNDISADGRRVVQDCKDELTRTRAEIQSYVEKLRPALKDIGDKTANDVDAKLGELDGFIAQKEQELQRNLADKQQAAIKAIDDKIEKMKESMSGAVSRLGRLLLWAAKKFFTWALQQFGYSLSDIQGIIDKGTAVLKAIFTHPIKFVKNLVAAAIQGFRNFSGNLLTHLKDAVFDWLNGSLEGITLPASWDLRGITSVALQMLGLTWVNLRGKLVRLTDEPTVKGLESGFDLVVSLVRDGPVAAWEKLKEMAEDIKQAFVTGVQDFIKIKIVQQAVQTVGTMLIPGAGMVRAIIGIYDTIVFFVQKARQIIQMIGSFLSSIGEIAAGNIAGAAAALENGLGKGLVLVVNFLARFLRLDGITAKVRQVIQKLHNKADGMLDRVAEWVVGKAHALGRLIVHRGTAPAKHEAAAVKPAASVVPSGMGNARGVKGGSKAVGEVDQPGPSLREQHGVHGKRHETGKTTFGALVGAVRAGAVALGLIPDKLIDTERGSHRLFVATVGGRPMLKMQSAEMTAGEFLRSAEADPSIPAAQKRRIPDGRALVATMDTAVFHFESEVLPVRRENQLRIITSAQERLGRILQEILKKTPINAFDQRYLLEGYAATYGSLEGLQRYDYMTPDHMPQYNLLLDVSRMPLFAAPDGVNIRAAASGKRGSGMKAINIHDDRHKAGRGATTANAAIPRIGTAIAAHPGNLPRQRVAVVQVLRSELVDDVTAMRNVIAMPLTSNAWRDLSKLATGPSAPLTVPQAETLRDRIRNQIDHGLSDMVNQPIDRYEK